MKASKTCKKRELSSSELANGCNQPVTKRKLDSVLSNRQLEQMFESKKKTKKYDTNS